MIRLAGQLYPSLWQGILIKWKWQDYHDFSILPKSLPQTSQIHKTYPKQNILTWQRSFLVHYGATLKLTSFTHFLDLSFEFEQLS